jgi:hypothetical protein
MSRDDSSSYVGSSVSKNSTSSVGGRIERTRYLEVCIDVGKYVTKLNKILVLPPSYEQSSLCTDSHLFRKIHDQYFAAKKSIWRRFLYRPTGVRFVHFGVQDGLRVDFFSKDPLSPDDVVSAKQYDYNLIPPVPPPIDSYSFLHYFWKHGDYAHTATSRYVRRLPKKMGESLVRTFHDDEFRQGWGIHILEGPNKAAICWVVQILIFISFITAFAYDISMKQQDTGFSIGQWVVASLAVTLTAVYFHVQDEIL